MEYNLYRSEAWGREIMTQYKGSPAYLMIEYKQPEVQESTTVINMSENSIGYAEMVTAEKYANWQNTHINFGPECENIVNALIEFGCFESVEDIWWGEEAE